jgi:acetyltransferase
MSIHNLDKLFKPQSVALMGACNAENHAGHTVLNLDLLIETMMRFSYLVADYPEFREIELNPLLVTPERIIALDAAAVLEDNPDDPAAKPYHHLAIRPYPEEYVRHAVMKSGAAVTLRPIRPEDEPLWQELLTTSSPESIRFRSMFKHVTHEMATRHCYIDYEREISIVGEVEESGERKLVGVGGLSAEGDQTIAEFAVLVTDRWQGKGLGGLLLDYCLEIAGHWGVQRIIAETDPRNVKMLESFQKRGFSAQADMEEEVVYLHKNLVAANNLTPAV